MIKRSRALTLAHIQATVTLVHILNLFTDWCRRRCCCCASAGSVTFCSPFDLIYLNIQLCLKRGLSFDFSMNSIQTVFYYTLMYHFFLCRSFLSVCILLESSAHTNQLMFVLCELCVSCRCFGIFFFLFSGLNFMPFCCLCHTQPSKWLMAKNVELAFSVVRFDGKIHLFRITSIN